MKYFRRGAVKASLNGIGSNVCGDQFVGRFLNGHRPPVEELPAILAADHAGETIETKFLTGICIMARRSTLDRHGLLEEATALGADDLEFSWRMRELKYRLVVAADIFVKHERGVSFATLSAQNARRQIRLSDAALVRKMKSYYGHGSLPSSEEIWGCDIFTEALNRGREAAKAE